MDGEDAARLLSILTYCVIKILYSPISTLAGRLCSTLLLSLEIKMTLDLAILKLAVFLSYYL